MQEEVAAQELFQLRIADRGLRKASARLFNPQSAIRTPKFYGVGQFFATLYPAASASSTLLNLT
jgi:hypothetical protein